MNGQSPINNLVCSVKQCEYHDTSDRCCAQEVKINVCCMGEVKKSANTECETFKPMCK